jgi:hypothetical protein
MGHSDMRFMRWYHALVAGTMRGFHGYAERLLSGPTVPGSLTIGRVR